MSKNYIRNLLLSLDQFGNSVFAGNPDSTISARTGYFSARYPDSLFWTLQQEVINFAFRPIDGDNHCWDAWQADKNETMYPAGSLVKTIMLLKNL